MKVLILVLSLIVTKCSVSPCHNLTLKEGYVLTADDVHFLNTSFQEIHRSRRETEIFEFISACSLIRDVNRQEYKNILETYPQFEGCDPVNIWKWYVSNGTMDSARKLQGLLDTKDYDDCWVSIVRAYEVTSVHIQNDRRTVRVLKQFGEGTQKTIKELLAAEMPKFLLTVRNMELFNKFVVSTGDKEFPFLKFEKEGFEYAIPQQH